MPHPRLLHLRADSPVRTPAWRLEAAAALDAARRAKPFWPWPPDIDPLVRHLLAARHGRRLASLDPAVVDRVRAAVAWAATAAPPARLEVEARLLAGQGDAAVAACVGTTASIVRALCIRP